MRRLLGWMACLLLVSGCVSYSASDSLPPFADVKPQFDEQVRKSMLKTGLSKNPKYIAKVEKIFSRMKTPGCRSIKVVNTAEVNAAAGPSDIYINSGLIQFVDNDAQLAFVIGHEIGHIKSDHIKTSYERYVKLHGMALKLALAMEKKIGHNLPVSKKSMAVVEKVGPYVVNVYGKDAEFEADKIGMELMRTAGYDTREAARFLGKLQEESGSVKGISSFLSTHPPLEERVSRLRMAESRPKGSSE